MSDALLILSLISCAISYLIDGCQTETGSYFVTSTVHLCMAKWSSNKLSFWAVDWSLEWYTELAYIPYTIYKILISHMYYKAYILQLATDYQWFLGFKSGKLKILSAAPCWSTTLHERPKIRFLILRYENTTHYQTVLTGNNYSTIKEWQPPMHKNSH